MYKIYVNNIPLLILGHDSPDLLPGEVLKLHYPGKRKFLLNVIDQLEKTNRLEGIELRVVSLENAWEEFKELFKIVPAAGGVVFNEQNKVLFIFRRGFWDLPKGKIEKGEGTSEAALREVEEETGIHRLTLMNPVCTTWHTYRQNGKRILKPTSWFGMKATTTTLQLQHEEDIETAEWIAPEDFLVQPPGKVYRAIVDVVSAANEALK